MIKPSASRNGSTRRWITIAGWGVLFVAVVLQWYSISRLRHESESLRAQLHASLLVSSNQPAASAGAEAIDVEQLKKDRLELLRLRNEVRQLRKQTASPTAVAQPDASPSVAPVIQPPSDEVGQLVLAATQGDASALDKLASLVVAMRTMKPEEAATARAGIHSAFQWLGTEAGKSNAAALQTVWQATRIRELQGFAVQALGQAAGLGNEEALKPLLHPEEYLILRSSATSALKPAADAGNERAIQALAATAADPTQQALWFMAAQGLESAAAAGNATAINGLATLAAVQNQSISKQAVLALEAAARKNQPRAEEALRKLGWR